MDVDGRISSLELKESEYHQYKNTNYYVTIDGKVFHKLPSGRYKKLKGSYEHDNKYKRIRINIGGIKIPVSRMVWETFKGSIPNGYVVIHKNGCFTINELFNLELVKLDNGKHLKGKNSRTRKIINLNNREIYKGTRKAAECLRHSRKLLTDICNGNIKRVKLNIAWYDDINSKPFRGDYVTYYNRYMKE